MKKIKILLLEDDPDAIAHFRTVLPEDQFEVAGVATTTDEALSLYRSLNVDIVILDIFIQGEPEGITVAHKINASARPTPFIFLTSSMDKTIFEQAKLTFPYSYLIKPFNILEFTFAVELAIEKFANKEDAFSRKRPIFYNDSFFVKHRSTLVKISLDEIEYITVEGPYCSMVTEKGNFVLQISLNKLMEELPAQQFIKTHRNYTVNAKKIDKVYPSDHLILLKSGKQVLLSRRLKDDFLNAYRIYK